MRFSIEAEQSVIGGLLIAPQRIDDITEIISAGDFYRVDHQLIFSAVCEMAASAKEIDFITVAEHMDGKGELDRAGGFGYLTELQANTAGAGNIAAYARIIADRAMERRITDSGLRIAEIGESPDSSVDEKLNTVHAEFAALEREEREEVADFNQLLKAEVSDIDGRFRKVGKPGLKIGFADLDERFGGIEDTDLWVLAARPSMGKTALALNIAHNVATQGQEVLIFSLEMSKEQLTKRLLSSASGVPYGVLRSGELLEHNWPQLSAGVAKLKDKKIHIIDIPAIDVNRALSIARKLSRKGNIGLIVIDYLQLMTAKTDKRFDEISYISRQLKVMAKTIKAPVLALSQLSRKCEERADKRPINSDLRESGQIEQDADIISFIYRDEVYNPDSCSKGIAEILTRKFRNGETGVDMLAAKLQFSRFEDLAPGYQAPEAAPVTPMRRGFK